MMTCDSRMANFSRRPASPRMKALGRAVLIATLVAVAVVLAGPARAGAEVFGVESFSDTFGNQYEAGSGGSADTAAGSHPDALTATFVFDHTVQKESEENVGEGPEPVEVTVPSSAKTVEVSLPQGMVVDPEATPTRCEESQLDAGSCPLSSAVGVLHAEVAGFPYRVFGALYNMVAPEGSPGQFATNLVGLGYVVHIDGEVRSDGNYALAAKVSEIIKTYPIYEVTTTLWGDPAAASHDSERGICANAPRVDKDNETCVLAPDETSEAALLTMPGSCSGQPLVSSSTVEPWTAETTATVFYGAPPLSGCGALGFDPSIQARPETAAASSSTGLSFDLHVPQQDAFTSLSTANLKDALVTFPAGMSVNPSSASGLQACTPAQIGLRPPSDGHQAITIEPPTAESFTLSFAGATTPSLPARASAAEVQAGLEALPAIGAGNVEVVGTTGGWEVLFKGALAGRETALLAGQVTDDASQLLDVQGTGGTFNLKLGADSTGASATGDVTAGSSTLTGLTAVNGTFLPGEEITGGGYPAGTTITNVNLGAGTLTLSAAASAAAAGTGQLAGAATGTGELTEGSNTIAAVSLNTGAFVVGEDLEGAGIPAETEIVAIHPGSIVLSADATSSGAAVALSAVTDAVTHLLGSSGTFAAGQLIEGAGIPPGTTILAVGKEQLKLSADATVAGVGVVLEADKPSGPSHVSAALPFYARAAVVQQALEALPVIGAGNVDVSGGGASDIYTGARNAYTVAFVGALAGHEVETLAAASALTGTGAGVKVTSQPPGQQPLAVAVTEEGGAVRFAEKVSNSENAGFLEDTDCPDASKIANVEVKTPLLEKPLPGSLYLAQQFENPFHALLAGYIVIEDAERGIVAKLAGRFEVGGEEGAGTGLEPGQIRASFDNNPELPVEDIKVTLFGGDRGTLTTPSTCGTYDTQSTLEPWSHQPAPGEEAGTPDAFPTSAFEITEGPGGGPCPKTPAEESNKPAFEAGTTTPTAGSFSPFVLRLSHEYDGSQPIHALDVTLPPGLTGKLAGIEKCPQTGIEQAQSREAEGDGNLEQEHPSCPSSSEVGTVTVGVGSGTPLYVHGHCYLAGPYDGAPFSLVFITPAVAGPFDLGAVVIRAGLYINPETAQVTVKSTIPTIVHGVPVQLRSLTASMTRPGFTLNPTSCEEMPITGTAFGESSQAPLFSLFKASGCSTLPFAPTLTASVTGTASKANGAGFYVKLTSPGIGQASIHKVDLTLPIALPSRLPTLQHACLAAVFQSNPAGCPESSVIGRATVHTPLLDGPLTGPAYIVSHGGAAFPDVEFVLQGEGVQLILDGQTQIVKEPDGTEITHSKFETVPDSPFSTFETELPAGPHSILGAYASAKEPYNLCKANLAMPTEITAQNGAVIRQTTAITPTGCPPSVSIAKTQIKHDSLSITVKLGQTGTLKITGKGLKSTTKKNLKAGTHTLTVQLTASGMAAKRHKRKLNIKVTLTAASETGTATMSLNT